MKKYFFEKIELYKYNGCHVVKFFLIKDNTKEDNTSKLDYCVPSSFKSFLGFLNETKVNCDGSYNITQFVPFYRAEGTPVSFDKLLQEFAEIVYARQAPNEAKLSKFYKNAYAIKEKAQKERDILNTPPKEMIK